ncbi:hypothetical protein Dda_4028 [Drechslerella dactyloides]|uniref:DUF2428 domain-containing protein n=1 Tax=Drechslerella dactyloides TaxID=74499 RepID=A0AAD6IYZ5_DREDA|nr:hypothetical protein Dda_4028 [Drechslerella dactyloides]
MEALESLGASVSEFTAASHTIPENILLLLRDKLIKLNVKDPSIDPVKTHRYLEIWVEPLLATGISSAIGDSQRVHCVDVLSIVFNRLGGMLKCWSSEIQPDPARRCIGQNYISLFREYFDQASPPLLKSLKDCLTTFVALGTETWEPSDRQKLATAVAQEVLDGTKTQNFKKGDLYLVEFLIKKRWLASRAFFMADLDGGSHHAINLESIFAMMDNRTLAPSAGRFLSSLLRRLAEESRTSGDNEASVALWLDYFKKDLANALLSDNEHVALNTELYVVPGTFHDEKQGFTLFVRYLLSLHADHWDAQSAMAIVGCLRTGKECGWLTEAQIDQYVDALGGYNTLISHQYGFLRSQTFRLMILSSSTSLPLSSTYIGILTNHLDDLFAESDPQIRNEIYSALRNMFERVMASSYTLNKRLKSMETRSQTLDLGESTGIEDVRKQLNEQKSFMSWFLNELLPAQLQPNSSYQSVILALRVYSFWLPQIERDTARAQSTVNLAADVKVSRKKQVDKENINLPFDPEINYSSLLRLVIERLMDPYDDIRSLAAGLIKALRQSREVPWPQIVQQAQRVIEESGRPGLEDGFSRVMEVLHDLSSKDPAIAQEVWLSCDLSPKHEPDYSIIELIFTLLDRQSQMRSDNQNKFRSRLDNSLLGALSLIYKRKDAVLLFEGCPGSQNVLKRILALSQDIWKREREVLCNESPEGRGAVSGTMGEEDSDDDEEDQLNNQGFLSYSWRIVSEASSLLGAVAKYVPKAFATVSEAESFLQKCGAIIISEIETKRKHLACLEYAFKSFRDTVHASKNASEGLGPDFNHLELPQVHALNCMRFLFMDSHLSEAIDPYAATSLRMAFSCFSSKIWAVRNCGIMLYTAIINRVLPAEGSRQTMKSDKFFQKYRALENVFRLTLAGGLDNLDDQHRAESVYPALDIISRLTFPEDPETEEPDSPVAFKRLVNRYLGCKIWKMREAAAKSILAFTPGRARAFEYFQQFILQILLDADRDNNLIHGSLCAAREIYEQKLVDAEEFKQQVISTVLDAADLYLVSNNRVSPINQALFIQISRAVLAEDNRLLRAKIVPFCYKVLDEAYNKPPCDFVESLLRKEIAKTMAAACPDAACAFISPEDQDYGIALSEALVISKVKVNIHKSARSLQVTALRVLPDDGATIPDPSNAPHIPEDIASEQDDGYTPFEIIYGVMISHEWEQYRLAAADLLLLSSHPEALDPDTLFELASLNWIEPLRESAIVLAGRNLHPLWLEDIITARFNAIVEAWIRLLFQNVQDEMPYSSRTAVLKSIEASSNMLKFNKNAQEQPIPTREMLPVWILLHKLLNDDEADIRILAANLTAKLISDSQSITPLQAERRLFQYLAAVNAAEDVEIRQILLNDLLCVPLDNPKMIKEQLITANTPNTLLFKIEKQNLYRDELRCMRYYLGLLTAANATTPHGKETATGYLPLLSTYTITGIETLSEIAQEYQVIPEDDGGVSIDSGKLRAADGIMGWTTATEDIFVLGMRIANAFRLLIAWYPEEKETHMAKEMVKRLVEYGVREDVGMNKAWLDAFTL